MPQRPGAHVGWRMPQVPPARRRGKSTPWPPESLETSLCCRPQGVRLQPPGKRSQPPATAAQLRLVIPLYSANSCTLCPSQLLLQPCLRPVLGRSWGARREGPGSTPPGLVCHHTHHTSEQSHRAVSSAACQCWPAAGKASGWLRRGPSSQATMQGPPPPAVGDAEPGTLALLPGPAGQEANIRKYFNHFFKTVKK